MVTMHSRYILTSYIQKIALVEPFPLLPLLYLCSKPYMYAIWTRAQIKLIHGYFFGKSYLNPDSERHLGRGMKKSVRKDHFSPLLRQFSGLGGSENGHLKKYCPKWTIFSQIANSDYRFVIYRSKYLSPPIFRSLGQK